MKNGISILAVAAVMLAMASPAMAIKAWWVAGADGDWGDTKTTNWSQNISGVETTPWLPVTTDVKAEVFGPYVVTVDVETNPLGVVEFGVTLNLETGGILTVIDLGDGELIPDGGTLNLLGGTLRMQDGTSIAGDGLAAILGSNGLSGEGVGWNAVNADGYTTYTDLPEPATMSLLAIGGLAMLRRRKRRA